MYKQLKSGFTLVELLVVIAIIGTLSAAFYGVYTQFIDEAKDSQTSEVCHQIKTAWSRYHTEAEGWPDEMQGSRVYRMDPDTCEIIGKTGFFDVLYNDNGRYNSQQVAKEPELAVGLLSTIGLRKFALTPKADLTDYLYHFCIDINEDGMIDSKDGLPSVFSNLTIRGDVAVWCWPEEGENNDGFTSGQSW